MPERMRASSPRTWGCFSSPRILDSARLVLPTHVGVFPMAGGIFFVVTGPPHARGGVSDPAQRTVCALQSSPRTWGCFHARVLRPRLSRVLPTHVGVFLTHCYPFPRPSGPPHARGGVSTVDAAPPSPSESSPRTWGCFRSTGRVLRRRAALPRTWPPRARRRRFRRGVSRWAAYRLDQSALRTVQVGPRPVQHFFFVDGAPSGPSPPTGIPPARQGLVALN